MEVKIRVKKVKKFALKNCVKKVILKKFVLKKPSPIQLEMDLKTRLTGLMGLLILLETDLRMPGSGQVINSDLCLDGSVIWDRPLGS